MSPPAPRQLAFDDVVIDFAGRRLLRGGAEQALEPKAFAVLALLAASPGQVFTRDEILDAVWGHRHVTPSVLNRITSLLRQTLGEDAQHPRRLHTVYGVGYRFDLPTPTSAPAPAPAGAVSVDAGAARPPDPPRPSPAAPRGRTRRTAAWLGAVTAAALLLFAAVRWSRPHDGTAAPAATSPARPALAVLPFADLSAGQDQAYLADGLAEEILDQLAQSPALRVVGRRSSFSFRGRSTDLRTIGQRLGVAHLLEGSVRRDGERLRVTAQLVRVEDGSQSWSKTYGRELNDVFAVQEEIARDVAMALSVTLDVARFSREQGGTGNVAAYERFLRWRNIVMREEFDFEHDRERLQLAREMVALDPQCVLCWDALAESLGAMAAEIGAAQAGPLRAEARQARERIAAIAPGSWLAKRDRAKALWNEGRYAAAIALAREVVDAGPLTQERVWDYAYMIYSLGHIDDAVALVEQVRAVEPMALFLSRDLQFDYTAARRYRDAEAEYRRGQSLEGSQAEPDYVAFFRHLAGQRPGGIANCASCMRACCGRTLTWTRRSSASWAPCSTTARPCWRGCGACLPTIPRPPAPIRPMWRSISPTRWAMPILRPRRCAASSRSAPATRRAARRGDIPTSPSGTHPTRRCARIRTSRRCCCRPAWSITGARPAAGATVARHWARRTSGAASAMPAGAPGAAAPGRCRCCRRNAGWRRRFACESWPPQPRFMVLKNSSLVLVFFILSRRNSIAASSSIGCSSLRRIQIFCSRSGSISSSSRRVPERLMLMAG